MNWIDQAVAYFSPATGFRRAQARAALRVMEQFSYDAAKTGRRTEGWIATGNSANAEIAGGLSRVRERSRDLVRNNPYAAKAVAEIVNSAIGTGISAQAQSDQAELNAGIDEAWSEWTSQCDADGQLGFPGLESLIARTVVESGEALVRFRSRLPNDGIRIPVQLQVLEPDWLDQSKTVSSATGYAIQGVQFNLWGQRTGYWLFGQHPGEVTTTSVRGSLISALVPASEILHVYRKDRPGQVRGMPWLATVALRLRDLDLYEDAELMRKKIEACVVGFITQPEAGAGPALGATSIDPTTGQRVEAFEPGMTKYLKPGENVVFNNPGAAGGYRDYKVTQLQAAAVGAGVTYEQLSGDLSQVNYSSFRAGHIPFQTMIECFRWVLLEPMLLSPVWRRVIDVGVTAGVISKRQYGVKWTAPKFYSADPRKDSESVLLDVRQGRQTLFDAIAEQGYDPVKQLEEIAAINKKLDDLGIILDCDPRRVTQTGLEQRKE